MINLPMCTLNRLHFYRRIPPSDIPNGNEFREEKLKHENRAGKPHYQGSNTYTCVAS
jgi:hypothetical protein